MSSPQEAENPVEVFCRAELESIKTLLQLLKDHKAQLESLYRTYQLCPLMNRSRPGCLQEALAPIEEDIRTANVDIANAEKLKASFEERLDRCEKGL